MTAFVAPLAITIRMEVMRRKKIMTLRAGWILVFMISVLLGVNLVSSNILGAPINPYTDSDRASSIGNFRRWTYRSERDAECKVLSEWDPVSWGLADCGVDRWSRMATSAFSSSAPQHGPVLDNADLMKSV